MDKLNLSFNNLSSRFSALMSSAPSSPSSKRRTRHRGFSVVINQKPASQPVSFSNDDIDNDFEEIDDLEIDNINNNIESLERDFNSSKQGELEFVNINVYSVDQNYLSIIERNKQNRKDEININNIKDDADWMNVETDLAGNIHITNAEASDIEIEPQFQIKFVQAKEKESGPKAQSAIIGSKEQLNPEIADNNTVHDDDSGLILNPEADELNETEMVILSDEHSVILSDDKKARRRLDKKSRMQTIALGLSSVALSSVLFSAAPFISTQVLANFLLLNSADLIKLGYRGRSSKLVLDQKDASLAGLLKQLALKNGKVSAIAYSTTQAVKLVFYTSSAMAPVTLVLLAKDLELLSQIGIRMNALSLAENALAGAASTFSTEWYGSRNKRRQRKRVSRIRRAMSDDSLLVKAKLENEKEREKKDIMRSAVIGGVKGMAGAVLGPVLSSPIAEKALFEACDFVSGSGK